MTSSIATETADLPGEIDPSETSPGAARRPWWRASGAAKWLLGALVLVCAFIAGYLPKERARAALVAGAADTNRELPVVAVVHPKLNKPGKTLTLPASLKGWEQTVLFARANGYVERWLVDLGDRVEKGQLMAELDTPELDREVEQARAAVAEASAGLTEAQAGRDYAHVNFERFKSLVPAGVATQGELQKAEAEAKVAEAKVGVAEAVRSSRVANLHRLEQLKSFARVSAPFAGVVTSRKVDRGSLVSAGSSALFELAVVEPLRVLVDVPQSLALGVKAGIVGTLRARELPNRTFEVSVARTSGNIEAASRTLRVELLLKGAEHALLPGMFAEVTLEIERRLATLSLPASAITSGKEGLRVATVDAEGVVHLKPVVLERDNGSEVEIASGIVVTDQVVASPRPFLAEGDRVKSRSAQP